MKYKFFVEAENESGSDWIVGVVDAPTWEDACDQLRDRASIKWPGTVWRPVCVASADVIKGQGVIHARRFARALFAALDVKLAAELKGDVLHAGTALATLMMIRDTVHALDPKLGELEFPQAHAAAEQRSKPGGIKLCPVCGRMLDQYGDCNYSDAKEDF